MWLQCETIIEEFEENIIKYYQKGEENIETKFCVDESYICPVKKPKVPSKELWSYISKQIIILINNLWYRVFYIWPVLWIFN